MYNNKCTCMECDGMWWLLNWRNTSVLWRCWAFRPLCLLKNFSLNIWMGIAMGIMACTWHLSITYWFSCKVSYCPCGLAEWSCWFCRMVVLAPSQVTSGRLQQESGPVLAGYWKTIRVSTRVQVQVSYNLPAGSISKKCPTNFTYLAWY